MGSNKKIAVIGGGLVGLATAFEIAQNFPDCSVTVFEKESSIATPEDNGI